jgi:hypothetical protein
MFHSLALSHNAKTPRNIGRPNYGRIAELLEHLRLRDTVSSLTTLSPKGNSCSNRDVAVGLRKQAQDN